MKNLYLARHKQSLFLSTKCHLYVCLSNHAIALNSVQLWTSDIFCGVSCAKSSSRMKGKKGKPLNTMANVQPLCPTRSPPVGFNVQLILHSALTLQIRKYLATLNLSHFQSISTGPSLNMTNCQLQLAWSTTCWNPLAFHQGHRIMGCPIVCQNPRYNITLLFRSMRHSQDTISDRQ